VSYKAHETTNQKVHNMKRPNITPGEWIVSRLASPDYAPQFGIYSSENTNDFATVKGDEANAHAIAALPDLLAALESIVGDSGQSWEADAAKAALIKAGYEFP
jgi:hypothetical protein